MKRGTQDVGIYHQIPLSHLTASNCISTLGCEYQLQQLWRSLLWRILRKSHPRGVGPEEYPTWETAVMRNTFPIEMSLEVNNISHLVPYSWCRLGQTETKQKQLKLLTSWLPSWLHQRQGRNIIRDLISFSLKTFQSSYFQYYLWLFIGE